jgi:hypothetical protein
MKKLSLLIILFFLSVNGAWAGYYYMNAGGSNTSPYDTWAKGATAFSSVYNQADGPHTVFIGPGTYASQLYLGHANQDGKQYIGISAAGVLANCVGADCLNYKAPMADLLADTGPIIDKGAAGSSITIDAAISVIVSNVGITTGGLGATNAAFAGYTAGTTLTINDSYLYNTGKELVVSTNGTLTLNRCQFSMAGQTTATGQAINVSGGTTTVNYGNFVPTISTPLTQGTASGVIVSGTGTLNINNSNISGTMGPTVSTTAVGATLNIKNSYLGSSWTNPQYTINNTSGTTNISNSIMVRNYGLTNQLNYAALSTDTNNLKVNNQKFTRFQRSGLMSINVDDSGNYGYVNTLAPILSARGKRGTFFVDGSAATRNGYISDINAIWNGGAGTFELGAHTWSSTILPYTNLLNFSQVGGSNCTVAYDGTTVTCECDGADYDQTYIATNKNIGEIITALNAKKGWTVVQSSTGGQTAILVSTYMKTSSIAVKGVTAVPTDLVADTTADCTVGLYKDEMADMLTWMSSNFSGWNLNIMATPGGQTSSGVNTAAKTCGYNSNRNGYSAATTAGYTLSSVDMYQQGFYNIPGYITKGQAITAIGNNGGLFRLTMTAHGFNDGETVVIEDATGTGTLNGSWVVVNKAANTIDLTGSTYDAGAVVTDAFAHASDTDVRTRTRALCEYSAQYGAVFHLLAHYKRDCTPMQMGVILDAIAEYSEIQVLPYSQIISTIKASPWTYDSGTGISTRSAWTDLSDYRLRAGSPAINAGTDLCGTLTNPVVDYAGRAVCTDSAYVGKGGAPEIGGYEFWPSGHGVFSGSEGWQW